MAWCATGCGNEPDTRDDTASGGSLPLTTLSASSDASDDAPADTGDKLDVGGADGTGMAEDGGNEAGCQKVDFLFVIDSSASMEDEQDNLLGSFPGFIDAIEQTLMIDDFHVMVVDAGLIAGAGCDGILGAGRVTSGIGQDCMLVGGLRYATADQPDLVATFTCIGSRGFGGPGDEQTMSSTLAAVGPLSAPGQCNDGFLRDDAILVVTIITDEEDSPGDTTPAPPLDGTCVPADADPNSNGDPAGWKASLVSAKGGNEDAIVVLSLIGDCDAGGTCPGIALEPTGGYSGAEPAPRLREFTQSFGYGSVGPVCAPDYAPFFTEAVSVIASACDGFVPQG
ncbi:hypothetical protein [Paraliomyxa miuraensis]|uniref:hypothetical protein n=1 Tax=Paraliomyxa miuraensis TaxID=376150 RepID=UPI00225B3F81|nr:hypothetical protein [Paraliomyxa miuraensis]